MSEDHIGFDAALRLCGDLHRRIVLGVLAEERQQLTIRDLAYAIAKHSPHLQSEAVSSEIVAQIQFSLYHNHLPLLEEAGVVEYDSKRKRAKTTEQFDDQWPSLSAIIEMDPELNLSDEFHK